MKITKLFVAVLVGLFAAMLALSACSSSDKVALDTDATAGPMKYQISSDWTANQEMGSPAISYVYSNYYEKSGDGDFYVVVAVYDLSKHSESDPPIASENARSPEDQAKETYDAKSYDGIAFTQDELESLTVSGADVKIYKEETTAEDNTFTRYIAYIQSQPSIEAFIECNDQETLEAIVKTISFE